jgi:hypothetical protein
MYKNELQFLFFAKYYYDNQIKKHKEKMEEKFCILTKLCRNTLKEEMT